jgi:hypothetical protein
MADLSQTITKLNVTHNPVPWGQGFSLSAHVTAAGHHRAHGDVEFFADAATLGVARTDSTGVAALGVPGGLIQPGGHEFTATFRGDAYNEPSDSEPMVINLSPADGDKWPAEDDVVRFKGTHQPEHDPTVKPVAVKEDPEPGMGGPIPLEPNGVDERPLAERDPALVGASLGNQDKVNEIQSREPKPEPV